MTESPAEDSAFERTLQHMVEDRMKIARDLADAASGVQRQREQLAVAESTYRASYDLALSNGWSNADLRKIGLPTPAAKPRPRARRKTKNNTPDQGSDND